MANKNSPKKLTLTAVRSDAKKTDEVVEIDFNEYDGTHFVVRLYPFFSNKGKTNVIEELRNNVQAMKKVEIELPDKMLPTFVIFLAVLEFSDFPRPKKMDIKQKMAYFYQVIETKYFRDVTEMMLEKEIQEIWKTVMQTVEMNEKLQNEINKQQSVMNAIQEKNAEDGK